MCDQKGGLCKITLKPYELMIKGGETFTSSKLDVTDYSSIRMIFTTSHNATLMIYYFEDRVLKSQILTSTAKRGEDPYKECVRVVNRGTHNGRRKIIRYTIFNCSKRNLDMTLKLEMFGVKRESKV